MVSSRQASLAEYCLHFFGGY